MAETRRLLDFKAAMAVVNSRVTLGTAQVGTQVLLTVQGKGTFLPKDEAKNRKFDSYLHNVSANDGLALARRENKLLFTQAMKAETAGNAVEADKLFNKWLNAVQISFDQIVDRGHRFSSGEKITATVAEWTAKAGHQCIVIREVRYKAPVAVEAIKHDMSSFLLDDEETPAEQTAPGAEAEAIGAEAIGTEATGAIADALPEAIAEANPVVTA